MPKQDTKVVKESSQTVSHTPPNILPIPPPVHLAQYNQILPGGANRILDNGLKKNCEFPHANEKREFYA